MRPPDHRDTAAVVLAVGLVVCLDVVAAGLVAAALLGRPVAGSGGEALAALVGLVGGILAGYMGSRRHPNDRSEG
jgi:membrane associated rhomboid family serine protease